MKMKAKRKEQPKTIYVGVRITPAMNEQLLKLAEQLGGDVGVSTLLRDIAERALAEGIQVS